MRVAIVSDTMVQSGGAERVVEVLAEAFPSAPVFAILYCPKRGPVSLASRVRRSWLQAIPGAVRFSKALLPLYPSAIEGFDLSSFDVIISSHHALAKGVLRSAGQVHICYCHTPMRALWERPNEEVYRAPWAARPFVRQILAALRMWDLATVSRVDHFLVNSGVTKHRVWKHYRRSSAVLHPPIDTERFTPGASVGDYYLVAGRNVPYKRIDLAIAAAERLGRRVVVVGDGTEKLSASNPNVEIRGKVADAELVALMRGARALIFPQFEDFGMTVLEMNACGRPVIAYGDGGALETVIDGTTGVLFRRQTVDDVCAAIVRFESMSFDPAAIREHALRFSKETFIATMRALVANIATASSVQDGGTDVMPETVLAASLR
jgi:glycosyltransferase involved in cell wall biosynthesis